MLNPRFLNICLVSLFIDCEQDIVIVEEYNNKIVYPMLVKCYHHLHPLIDNGSIFTKENIVEICNLDIFEMTTNTNELAKELINKQRVVDIQNYQVKEIIKCLLQWWQKHKSMFLPMGFLAHQILGIAGSKIYI
jgi:hypothetical protein